MSDRSSASLISVVIPTRHRPGALANCLDRLAPEAQTLAPENYEVIVTDDGDADDSRRLIADRYPWCRYTAGPRRGPAANRNHGVTVAAGEWMAFTDDDCVPSPGWLSAFRAVASADVRICEGRTTCAAGVKSPMYSAPVNLTGGFLWSCNMLVAADLFRSIGGFDERYPLPHMEDVEFRERVKRAGHHVEFVPAAVVDHPPRPIPTGLRRAALHECEVIYAWQQQRQTPPLLGYLARLAKSRALGIMRSPISTDSVRAAAHATVEVASVAVQFNRWCRRARASAP